LVKVLELFVGAGASDPEDVDAPRFPGPDPLRHGLIDRKRTLAPTGDQDDTTAGLDAEALTGVFGACRRGRRDRVPGIEHARSRALVEVPHRLRQAEIDLLHPLCEPAIRQSWIRVLLLDRGRYAQAPRPPYHGHTGKAACAEHRDGMLF